MKISKIFAICIVVFSVAMIYASDAQAITVTDSPQFACGGGCDKPKPAPKPDDTGACGGGCDKPKPAPKPDDTGGGCGGGGCDKPKPAPEPDVFCGGGCGKDKDKDKTGA